VTGFTDDDVLRYARQINIPDIGVTGQERLLESSALVVGAGGLGSPALLYLTAAGVGRIGVVDAECVDLTNLQRQIAHGMADLGRNKAVSARDAMRSIDPDVEVAVFEDRLVAANALEVLSGWDVVLDCTDNFPARYLLNDACVMLGKTLVTAAVLRFYGQITTVVPRVGPCLRCVMPEPPAPGTVPTCAQAGIVGPVAGAFGCLQAIEALKVLLGAPGGLVGRTFVLDALTFESNVLEVARDPSCPVCGEIPRITSLADVPGGC
jgi:molybdopterin/thiamine biosynthesis adenylyltransferase